MFDENQLVEMQWSRRNKTHFVELGYQFTKMGDVFYVKAKDLMRTSKVLVKVVCDYCGKEYMVSYGSFLNMDLTNNKFACRNCATAKAKEIHREERISKNYYEVVNKCKENNLLLITTEESAFSNKHKGKVTIECPKHGRQEVNIHRFLNTDLGCPKCNIDKGRDSVRILADEAKENIEKYNGNIVLNIEDYVDMYANNLKIQCSCGEIYVTSYCAYSRSLVKKCPKCSKAESLGERIIREFLESNDIEFEQQKRFSQCVSKRSLPFDFYLNKYNTCIEFDGPQHFKPVFSDENFLYIQSHDLIKDKFCEENGIRLIRIPYWESQNLEQILTEKLNLNVI